MIYPLSVFIIGPQTRFYILTKIGDRGMKIINTQSEKLGRNSPCPCGSGKKFKHCCVDNEVANQMDSESENRMKDIDPIKLQREMQQMMGKMAKIINAKGMSVEDANNYFVGKNIDDIFSEADDVLDDKSNAERAVDLVYQAYEEDSPKEQIELIDKALALDPDCVDAIVFLAHLISEGPHEELPLLERAVAAGAKKLGDVFFKENSGELWYMHEARPFMRAKFELAQTLWELRRQPEAIKMCWELLELNKNDNQGVRYVLLDYLILQNEKAEIERLLPMFVDEGSAHWLFNKALYLFLKHGPESKEAKTVLLAAHSANKFVAKYLLGFKEMSGEVPASYTMGGEDEAVCYVGDSGLGWLYNLKSLRWMAESLGLNKEIEKRVAPKKKRSKKTH